MKLQAIDVQCSPGIAVIRLNRPENEPTCMPSALRPAKTRRRR